MAFQAGEFASASMEGSSAPTAAHALVRVGSSLGLLVILGEHLAPGGSESCPAPTSGVACLGRALFELAHRTSGTIMGCVDNKAAIAQAEDEKLQRKWPHIWTEPIATDRYKLAWIKSLL